MLLFLKEKIIRIFQFLYVNGYWHDNKKYQSEDMDLLSPPEYFVLPYLVHFSLIDSGELHESSFYFKGA